MAIRRHNKLATIAIRRIVQMNHNTTMAMTRARYRGWVVVFLAGVYRHICCLRRTGHPLGGNSREETIIYRPHPGSLPWRQSVVYPLLETSHKNSTVVFDKVRDDVGLHGTKLNSSEYDILRITHLKSAGISWRWLIDLLSTGQSTWQEIWRPSKTNKALSLLINNRLLRRSLPGRVVEIAAQFPRG